MTVLTKFFRVGPKMMKHILASAVLAVSTTAAFAQETDDTVSAVDCTLPENAELQACIDLNALDATAFVQSAIPLFAVLGAGIVGIGGNANSGGGGGGGGGGGPTTPTTPTTPSTN